MAKSRTIVVRTETWKSGIKAVVRTEKGTFLGATNQTATVAPVIVGRS